MSEYSELRQWIADAKYTVFFGGAGVSCESGIPDFRGTDGLYQSEKDGLSPEEILHHDYFIAHPDAFYAYYRQHMLYPNACPNPAHLALAALERAGRLSAVITQNIDGLHQLAGSKRVLELHGSVLRNYCMQCGARYGLEEVQTADPHPVCPQCGGLIRPDVVLYGEGLDTDVFEAAEAEIRQADLLLVGGTSLTVNPAASLIRYFRGSRLVILNMTPTPYDRYAACCIREPIGQVLGTLLKNGVLQL